MSDLIVVGFKDEFKADEVMSELRRLQSEYLVDLEDAAVVVRNQEGKVKIKQAQELVAAALVSWSSFSRDTTLYASAVGGDASSSTPSVGPPISCQAANPPMI